MRQQLSPVTEKELAEGNVLAFKWSRELCDSSLSLFRKLEPEQVREVIPEKDFFVLEKTKGIRSQVFEQYMSLQSSMASRAYNKLHGAVSLGCLLTEASSAAHNATWTYRATTVRFYDYIYVSLWKRMRSCSIMTDIEKVTNKQGEKPCCS